MTLITAYIAILCFYGTSKYFPESFASLGNLLKKSKALSLILGVIFSFLSLWSLSSHFNLSTAIVYWLVFLMTLLSSVIVSLKIHHYWMFFWLLLSFAVLIIEFTI